MSVPVRTGRFMVEFLSDWHVGTGIGGAGGLDALIAREPVDVSGSGGGAHHDVPFLPAKALTGLLREAAELLAAGLDGDGRTWSRLVEQLFGGWSADAEDRAPRSALVSVRPGHLSPEYVARFAADPTSLVGAATKTAIDELGAAAHGTLRSIEIGSAGASFSADLALSGDPVVDSDRAWAFLTVAASLVDAVGAHGRRGFGRCRAWLDGGDDEVGDSLEVAIALIKADASGQPAPAVASETAHSVVTPVNAGGVGDVGGVGNAEEVTVVVDIECLTPLLVTPTVAGNVTIGRDHVPGRVLLPVICRQLDAAGFDSGNLVATGALRVEDALPVDTSVERSSGVGVGLPMPFAFSRRKDGGTSPRVWNTLRKRPDVQAKQLRGGFLVGSTAADLGHLTTAMTVRMHASLAGAARNGRDVDGGLFSYKAIEVGAVLRTRVHMRAPGAVGEAVAQAIGGPAALGTSRKDDYGQVVLRAQVDRTATPSSGGPAERGELVVWATSPLVVVDPVTGRFDPTVEGLRRELGRLVSRRTGKEVAFELVDVGDTPSHRIRVARMDGFHGRWGLPQLALVAIAPGSVVRLRRPDGSQLGEALGYIERWGLGRRTAEGFGSVRFDAPQLEVDTLDELPTRSTTRGRRVPTRGGEDITVRRTAPAPPTRPVGRLVGPSPLRGPVEVVLEARLVVDSPLLVGGERSEDDDLPGEVLRPLRRVDGVTVLPGSSIAGSLRSELRRRWPVVAGAPDPLVGLFGDLSDVGKSPLGVDDVVLVDAKEHRWDRVAIDRATGTVAGSAKFAMAAVEPGTHGTLRLRCSLNAAQAAELHRSAPAQVQQPPVHAASPVGWLRRAVALLCGPEGFRVGRNASTGWGCVRLEQPKMAVFPLDEPDGVLDLARLRAGAPLAEGSLNEFIAVGDLPPSGADAVAEIYFSPRLPVIVGSGRPGAATAWPLVVRRQRGNGGQASAVAVLPGSSIKGVLRSRAEWLVRTALQTDLNERAAEDLPIVPLLFGSGPTNGRPARRGALRIAECTAPLEMGWETWMALDGDDNGPLLHERVGAANAAPDGPHLEVRQHVAIDRWTGGSADARLFSVVEPWGLTWSPIRLTLDDAQLPEDVLTRRAAVALLLLLLEEVHDGAVSFGGGTTRGRGSITVESIKTTGLDRVARFDDTEIATSAEAMLDEAINATNVTGSSPLTGLNEAPGRYDALQCALETALDAPPLAQEQAGEAR